MLYPVCCMLFEIVLGLCRRYDVFHKFLESNRRFILQMVSDVRVGWYRYVHCSDHPAPCLTCQCVPTCCVTVTILPGDSHGHSVALERSSDTRWEPIDRCCHLSFNTEKWMTHCQHSVQRATQLSYCPCSCLR